jgi:ubiquinone/menaquinone biosynthesis C-methylase UbiE
LNIVLKKADISSLPFDDNFFDCAIFIAGLHCISSPEKREKALKELFRVMKPKAQALISVWSKNNQRIKNKPKEARIPWTIGKVKYYRYNYTFSKIELESLIKKCGFKLVNSWEDNNIFVIAEKP